MNQTFEHLMTLLEQNGFSSWFYGPVFILLWVCTLLLIKHIFLRHLARIARLTHNRIDDHVIKSISFPITVVIWGSAFALIGKLMPIDTKWIWITSRIFQASLVLAMIMAMDRLLVRLLDDYSKKSDRLPFSPSLSRGIIHGVIISLGSLVLLEMIGVSITPFLASLGIGSLAVALGLQSTLSNLFSGMQIMADKSIRPGDFVKLTTGDAGYVIEIGWRSTRFQKLSGHTLIIPNSQLVGSILTNCSIPVRNFGVSVDWGVGYESDLDQVERVTLETARDIVKNVKGARTDVAPQFFYNALSDSKISITVNFATNSPADGDLVKHEFIKELIKRYRKEGISIPFPTRTLDIPGNLLNSLKK